MEQFYFPQNGFFDKKNKFYICELVVLVAQLRAAAKQNSGTTALGCEKSPLQTEIKLILNAY